MSYFLCFFTRSSSPPERVAKLSGNISWCSIWWDTVLFRLFFDLFAYLLGYAGSLFLSFCFLCVAVEQGYFSCKLQHHYWCRRTRCPLTTITKINHTVNWADHSYELKIHRYHMNLPSLNTYSPRNRSVVLAAALTQSGNL